MKKILFLIILLFVSHTQAQEICPIAKGVDLDTFKRIPVLEEGRLKPLDTYARNVLLAFSGKTKYQDVEAIDWLARLLFDSQRTREDQVFLINNPLIAETLGIEVEKSRRYSFAQLQDAYPKLQELALAAYSIEAKERDIIEVELIRVFESLNLYSKLSLTFMFALPHPDFTIDDAGVKQTFELSPDTNVYSYLDIALRAQNLQQSLLAVQSKPQEEWDEGSKQVVSATSQLFQWSMTYNSLPLQFVPSYRTQDEQFYSPWDVMGDALTTSEGRAELVLLQNIVFDYWNGRQIEFDLNVKQLLDSFEERSTMDYDADTTSLNLELIYNQAKPFFWAKFLYIIVFLVVMCSYLGWAIALRTLSGWILIGAIILHTIGLVMRIMILQRPPVTNLYETFIFVGFISVLVGLFIERIHKQGLGQLVASISGFIFLMIASKFALDGDTLQMLVAVLNSNFWLSTHVLTITTGYAGVCVAGIIGHIYMIQAICKPKEKEVLANTYRIMLGALGFGLTMSFLGTNLGGIWADQSWGRFWGWDPKENGALMIILWSAMLFHAKIGRMIGPLGMAVGCALGNIVVVWAWFGVNLLSVGLHSYGFTSGLARNIIIYVVVQLLFLVMFTPLAKRKLVA